MLRRAIGLVLFTILLGLPLTKAVAAHAVLARSMPAAGATIEAAPSELVLEFTEELNPRFNTVRLLNSAKLRWSPGSAG